MNTKTSAWTGRAPRSMTQAFNPYADHYLHPMPDLKTPRVVTGAFLASVMGAAFAVLLFFWLSA
jgi:hypothetical protein